MTAPVTMLRPLNIGEIFDRAVTLYIKNFVTFTLIALTVLAPYGAAMYFFAPDQSTQLQQIFDQAGKTSGHAGSHAAPPDPFAGYSLEKGVGFALSLLLFLGLAPFSTSAVALGVAAIYAGKRPDYRASYGLAFARWGQIFGVGFMSSLIFIGLYLGFVIIFAVALVGGSSAVESALPLAIALFVLAALVAIAFLIGLIIVFLVATFAFYAVVIERSAVLPAIGMSFQRIVNRREFWKAVLMALATLAVQGGIASIVGTIGLVLSFVTHTTLWQIAIGVLTNAMLTGFGTVLLAVYYYDVRTRREGLDLEVQLHGLQPT